MNNFFLFTPLGVLLLGIVGSLIGSLLLACFPKAKSGLKNQFAKSGFGHFFWRIIVSLILFCSALYYATSAYISFHQRGFTNGVNFVVSSYFCYWILGRLLSFNGYSLLVFIESADRAWNNFSVWISPKHSHEIGNIDSLDIDIPNMIRHLDSKMFSDTTDTILKLVKLGEPAIAPLIHALDDQDLEIQLNSVRVLHLLGNVTALEPLAVKFTRDSSTRMEVARAIGSLGNDGIWCLIKFLQNADTDIRNAALNGLRYSDSIIAVAPLEKLLEDYIDKLKHDTEANIDDAIASFLESHNYDSTKRLEVYDRLLTSKRKQYDLEIWWFPRNIGRALSCLASTCLKK